MVSLIDNSLAKACALKRARAGTGSAERPAKRSKLVSAVRVAKRTIINSSQSPCLALRAREHDLCPYAFLRSVLVDDRGQASDAPEWPSKLMQPLHASEFLPPTEEQMAAYSHEAVAAVRSGDVEALQRIRIRGGTLACCNRSGESLLHVACRRGSPDVVSFLLNEGGVSPRIKDDYGRTPLHDACWRGSPEYKIVELLLNSEPRLAFVKDVRGHKPFQYARREHWGAWRDFLDRRRDLLLAC